MKHIKIIFFHLNGYAYLQYKQNYIYRSAYDSQALYGYNGGYNALIYKGAKRIILSDEDIAEFCRRMNGRTMFEEMTFAGFKESDLKYDVADKDKFYGFYPNGIPQPMGIAFKFENDSVIRKRLSFIKVSICLANIWIALLQPAKCGG